jgi:hypothetical protein
VLTTRRAAAPSTSWLVARVGGAMILTVMTVTSAYAGGGVTETSCVGTLRDFNCVTLWGPAGDPNVRLVPQPLSEAEKARVLAHERRWLARCHPVLAHDRYGVSRYQYAAPGCEFGVGED